MAPDVLGPSNQYRDPDRLIFNMGNLIPGMTVFILKRGPGGDPQQ